MRLGRLVETGQIVPSSRSAMRKEVSVLAFRSVPIAKVN